MRNEIRIAGFGGQGVILAGVTISQAAGVYADMEVAQTQSYGPEARGGACKCDVVVSSERILYPKVQKPSVLVAMSQPALDKYASDADPERTLLIVDSSLVTELPAGFARVIKVPATEIAENSLGKRMVANMVILGAVAAVAPDVLPMDALVAAIHDVVNPKFRELNEKAVQAGHAAAAGAGVPA
jgi:2-oxoglutarate ferredoxin oxidoreductase subunit gamma